MSSSFAWVDFADKDREHVANVISLFQEQSTVDDLGFGPVRDALSDMLFPGINTIQTRARYFLFVPWIYRGRIWSGCSASEVRDTAREDEAALSQELSKASDTFGVFGKQSGVALERPASNVYWSGLRTLGICNFSGSQHEYHRSVGRSQDDDASLRDDDGQHLGGKAGWDRGLPPRPARFPKNATLQLSRADALYLQERITTKVPTTLFAHLVRAPSRTESVGQIWEHPERSSFSRSLQEQLTHAEHFAIVTHGAALLYGLMVSEKLKNADWTDRYRASLSEWARQMHQSEPAHRSWSREAFWKLVGTQRPPTRTFIDRWLGRSLQNAGTIVDDSEVRIAIEEREYALKGARARLRNEAARGRWQGGALPVPARYRWTQAKVIIKDITDGLSRDERE